MSKRFRKHINDSVRLDTKFSRAIRKYGQNNFYIEPLEQNVPIELLDEREVYYIDKYDSYYNGYNSTLGGQKYKRIEHIGVIQLWEKSYSMSKIAAVLNLDRETVRRCLLHNGYTEE